jgi:hypothetical protein
VRTAAILEYSRGAIVALNLATNLNAEGCPQGRLPSPIKFPGLVDAVRKSMPMWQGDWTAEVDVTVHVRKRHEPNIGINAAIWIHRIGNIRSVTAQPSPTAR